MHTHKHKTIRKSNFRKGVILHLKVENGVQLKRNSQGTKEQLS